MNLKVLGVLAGDDFPENILREWASQADVLYAADSAADRLIPFGLQPVIVGDLDSVRQESLESSSRVIRDADPDRTDCEKLLSLVELDGHHTLAVAGIEGDLMDHVLASLSSIAKSKLNITIITRKSLGYVVRPDTPASIPSCFGRRVSLIPLTHCSGVALSGVLWEVDQVIMEPGGFLSISNEGVGDVRASLTSGCAILFIQWLPSDGFKW